MNVKPSDERGRIRITGFDTATVRERDDLSEWAPALGEGSGTGRLGRAWRRFRANRSATFGLTVIAVMAVLAVFARPISVPDASPLFSGLTVQPFSLAPYDPSAANFNALSQPPSLTHPFGTDWAGRDILSRVMYGGRWSLTIGFIVVGLALFIGVPLGSVAGYYGGWIDEVVMRLVDTLYAFPLLVLVIALISVLGTGFVQMIIALVVTGWIGSARLIRGEILSVKENEYVLAAKALGASDRSIIFRHIVPNAMAPVIVQSTLGVGTVVLAAAGLGFLGLGLDPGTSEWGSMLSRGRSTLIQGQWWVTVFPGLAIFLFVLAINLVGDGLRDAFDPKSDGGGRGGIR